MPSKRYRCLICKKELTQDEVIFGADYSHHYCKDCVGLPLIKVVRK